MPLSFDLSEKTCCFYFVVAEFSTVVDFRKCVKTFYCDKDLITGLTRQHVRETYS